MRHYDKELKETILTCVEGFWKTNSRNPNAQEVSDIINKPKTTVYRYVLKWQKKVYLIIQKMME